MSYFGGCQNFRFLSAGRMYFAMTDATEKYACAWSRFFLTNRSVFGPRSLTTSTRCASFSALARQASTNPGCSFSSSINSTPKMAPSGVDGGNPASGPALSDHMTRTPKLTRPYPMISREAWLLASQNVVCATYGGAQIGPSTVNAHGFNIPGCSGSILGLHPIRTARRPSKAERSEVRGSPPRFRASHLRQRQRVFHHGIGLVEIISGKPGVIDQSRSAVGFRAKSQFDPGTQQFNRPRKALTAAFHLPSVLSFAAPGSASPQ